MYSGNHMIDGDNGEDPRSPYYNGPEQETCECCEGNGQVIDNIEGEHVLIPCPICQGEGFIEK